MYEKRTIWKLHGELPDYQPNEKDPVEELLYGDPERIELKAQLKELKEKKLYDLCVKRKFNREPDKTVQEVKLGIDVFLDFFHNMEQNIK